MMKKVTAILLSVLLLTLLCAPALAFADYDLVYDATGLLDPDVLSQLGETTFPRLRDAYDIEVRVDIVSNLEDHDIDDYADIFYDQFGYGSGDNHNGVLLMIYLLEGENDLSFGDFVLTGAGTGTSILADHGSELSEKLSEYLNEENFSGPLEEDDEYCSQALATYAREMENYITQDLTAVRSGDDELQSLDDDELQSLDDDPQTAVDSIAMNSVPCVVDLSGILTQDQVQSLEETSKQISQAYECAVYTIIVDDYADYGGSVRSAAEAIYVTNELGYGEGKDGVMLLLSMDDRDYSLIAYGYGNTAFTDYGKDVLVDEFLDDFRYDDWYSGLQDYVNTSGEMLRLAREGNPVDGYVDDSEYTNGSYGEEFAYKGKHGPSAGMIFFTVILLPLAIAGIVCLIQKGKMKSVRSAYTAADYAVPGSMQLWVNQDIFTHTTEHRVRIQTESRSGGGGGTSISSSGFSGKSGKF